MVKEGNHSDRIFKNQGWDGEASKQVKLLLATKCDDLSFIPEIHVMERQN